MKIELDYKFGQSIYIKNDDEQREYLLNRIILENKGRASLELLAPDVEIFEVNEIHTTKEIDNLKRLGANPED